MMRTLEPRPWIAMVLVAVACSDRPFGDDASDASETGETGGSSGAGTSEGSDGPGADETGAPACEWEPTPFTGIDGGPGCEDLVSGGETAPVRVRIVNDGDAPIHLSTPVACTTPRFLVEDAAGRRFPPEHCTTVCDEAVVHQCGCILECPLSPILALHPGGVLEEEWPGIVAEAHEASVACAGDCAGPCVRATNPDEGRLRTWVALAGRLDCGDACDCEPNEEGWCEAPGMPLEPPDLVELGASWPPRCGVIELRVP